MLVQCYIIMIPGTLCVCFVYVCSLSINVHLLLVCYDWYTYIMCLSILHSVLISVREFQEKDGVCVASVQ